MNAAKNTVTLKMLRKKENGYKYGQIFFWKVILIQNIESGIVSFRNYFFNNTS